MDKKEAKSILDSFDRMAIMRGVKDATELHTGGWMTPADAAYYENALAAMEDTDQDTKHKTNGKKK